MTTVDLVPDGAPCWVDLTSSNVTRSLAFYSSVFGWTLAEPQGEFGGYFTFLKDAQPVAGAMQCTTDDVDVWSTYLHTPDAAETLARAIEHGASVTAPAAQIGELGTIAVITDSGGAAVRMWEPKEFTGFARSREPGSAVWFELYTRDYDRVVAFYRDVFNWDANVMSDTPEFRYSTLNNVDEVLAGIMDARSYLDAGVRPYWSVYFAVSDTDATIESAVRLGASVKSPALDTEYGRMAALIDPTGAEFRVMAS